MEEQLQRTLVFAVMGLVVFLVGLQCDASTWCAKTECSSGLPVHVYMCECVCPLPVAFLVFFIYSCLPLPLL